MSSPTGHEPKGKEDTQTQPNRRFSSANKKKDLVVSSDSTGSDSDSDSERARKDSNWKPFEPMSIDTTYSTDNRPPTGLAGFFRNLTNKLFPEEQNEPVNIEAMRSRVRVEPKTYFANERTLLQWLNLCIFLAIGAFALIKLSAPGAGWVGGSVLILSIVFSMYSLGVFHYRRHAIASTSIYGHYDDKIGPTILVLAIIIYLIGTLVFQLIIPTTLPSGVFDLTRDYRVTLDEKFLAQARIDRKEALRTLRNQIEAAITNYELTGFSINGDATLSVSSQREEFFDTQSTCILYNNGFYLKQVETNNAYSNQIYTSLERHTGDLMKAQELDSSYLNHTAFQVISPPLSFEHFRQRSLPVQTVRYFPHVQQVANSFTTMLMWDSIKSSHMNDPLVKVNNVEVLLTVYGDSQLSFGSYHKGKVRTLIWELVEFGAPNTIIHAQLSFTYPTTNIGSMSQTELTNMNDLFKAISSGLTFAYNTTQKMIEQVVYEFAPFC